MIFGMWMHDHKAVCRVPNIIALSGKTKKVMVRTSFAEKKQKRQKKKKSD